MDYDDDDDQSIQTFQTFHTAFVPDVPKLNYSEIVIGDLLGSGGFSNVYSIDQINIHPKSPNDKNEYDRRNRKLLAKTCNMPYSTENSSTYTNGHTSPDSSMIEMMDQSNGSHRSNGSGDCMKTSSYFRQRYVFKALRPDLLENDRNKGMVDLAVEARFLATFSHPHIITMRATSDVDPLQHNFFVVLDHLTITLDKQLYYWRQRVNKSRGWKCFYFASCKRLFCHPCLIKLACANKHRLHALWVERLTVAKNIALAIQYLHKHDVVYRDLKPDNIGFNDIGDVKIFDFGLAKRLQKQDKLENDLYNLTGNTGSLRYMAPEVAMGLPYDQRVDAYSFGILFWQLCSLTTPYSGYTCKMHADFVVRQGDRPQPDLSWQRSWIDLMMACWDPDIYDRPDFKDIVEVLENEITHLVMDDGMNGSSPDMLKFVKPTKKEKPIKAAELDYDTRIHSHEDDAYTIQDNLLL